MIDGPTLMALPKDFQEFQYMLPLSGLRMKLKRLLEEVLIKI